MADTLLPTSNTLPLDDPMSMLSLGLSSSDLGGLMTFGLGSTPSADPLFALAPQPDPLTGLSTFTLFDGNGNTATVPGSTNPTLSTIASYQTSSGAPAIRVPGALSTSQIAGLNTPKAGSDGQQFYTYSGSDMRVMLELAGGQGGRKQLIELTTISVSIYRVKTPATACGYINPKGLARGRRTIAGTMVLNQFTMDFLYEFLTGAQMTAHGDLSKDTMSVKADQLPPFNLTLSFADEYSNSSYRRLLGVDVLNDGTVYSQRDMFTEQTLSYMASDFTPLLPVGSAATFHPSLNSGNAQQRTPKDVLLASMNNQGTVSPLFNL